MPKGKHMSTAKFNQLMEDVEQTSENALWKGVWMRRTRSNPTVYVPADRQKNTKKKNAKKKSAKKNNANKNNTKKNNTKKNNAKKNNTKKKNAKKNNAKKKSN